MGELGLTFGLDLDSRMNDTLIQMGLKQWESRWLPGSTLGIRGRVDPDRKMIEIYDLNEEEAWITFIHELVEIRMRSALRPYRILVNKLIEGYQEIVDTEKDIFIESLIEVFDLLQDSPRDA
jgi:hypothetical protein